MARHRQKDEEAGGEGLGVVCTRTRMWRDADGNVVTKRPKEPHQPDPTGAAPAMESQTVEPVPQMHQSPISPPASFDLPPLMEPNQEMFDLFPDMPWDSHVAQTVSSNSLNGTAMVDDIFNPDTGTASSSTSFGTY